MAVDLGESPAAVFSVDIPRGLFRTGTNNVIAVEVHQQEANPNAEAESDNLFDMEMSFQRNLGVLPSSRLTIARGTGNVLVTWTGGTNFTLYATTNLASPWVPLAPNVGNNGYRTTPPAGSQQFFKTVYEP